MSRVVIGATWDDSAPHLSKEAKDELFNSYAEYQRDARTRGIPQLGSGAIYPFAESQIRVTDFDPPKHFRRGFGMDTALAGYTAIVWGAFDSENQTLYITACYKRPKAETAIHVEAIKARGLWMPGVGDAAGVIDVDRTRFLDIYRAHGVDLELADKSVEAGITSVFDALSTGKLKVFTSCTAWFEEFRMYRRDEKHRIVKENDHIMDATRYLVRSGIARMTTKPIEDPVEQRVYHDRESSTLRWMD